MKRSPLAIKPTRLSQPFWDAASKHRLLLQRDVASGRCQFYPRPLSLFNAASALEWVESAGKGELVAQTLCHSPAPGYEEQAPYLVGIVRLDEGPRIFARIVNTGATGACVGQRVRLAWDDSRADRPLYQFEPE